LFFSRLTALPFELVHADVCSNKWRDGRPRGIAVFPNLDGKSQPRQRVARMGASRAGAIAIRGVDQRVRFRIVAAS
jgi:hypothetical protein